MVSEGKINRNAGKKVLIKVIEEDVDPVSYCEENGIGTQTDTSLITSVVEKVIEANPKAVADFRGGKEKAIMSLFGACMKELRGNGDPAVIKQILEEKIKE